MTCEWPEGACACYTAHSQRSDPSGRVWMHCEEGLTLTKASMSRFVMFCLTSNIEIGDIHPFNYRYPRSLVSAAVRLRPDQFEAFERETGGKLRKPPKLSVNAHSAEIVPEATEPLCVKCGAPKSNHPFRHPFQLSN